MAVFVARRLLMAVPVLFLVSAIAFSVIHFIPGDPAAVILGRNASAEQLAALRHQLGLDRPVPVQFAAWLGGAVRGDLGKSLSSRRPVVELLAQRLPITLSLAVFAMLISLLVSVPSGIIAAGRRGTWWDRAIMAGALVGVSTPSFWAGILLIILFSVRLGWLPSGGFVSLFEDFGAGVRYLLLPAVSLGLLLAAVTARMVRASLLEVLGQDYVRTARAKGLAERVVVYRHALRNALIPVVTVAGMDFGWLLGGTVVVESVFRLPGMGRFIINAILARDYPVVQAGVLYLAVIFMLVNLTVDVLYGYLDPRIRHG